MKPSKTWLAPAAFACLGFAAHPSLAQSATAPDAVWIRLNGTQKLTQSILPLMAQKSGQTSQTIATVPLLTHKNHSVYLSLPGAGLVGYGVIVDTWLSDVQLDAPIDGNDVTAKFLPPASGTSGRLMTWFDLSAAEVRFKLHVQMRPVATGIPKEALSQLSFHRIFQIEVDRFHGSVDFRLGRQGNGIIIEDGSQYLLQLGSVAIDNPTLLQQTADFVLGFDRLFNIVGATSTNQAVTKITNALLMQPMDIDGDLQSMMNNALKAIATQGFPQQEVLLPNGGLMLFGAQFAGLSTSENVAVSGWQLQLDAKPDGKAPGITYVKQPRAFENIGSVTQQADAQVFLPYTTLELAACEMIQAGWMLSIPVADPDGSGPLQSFDMHLIPTSVPRVRPDPAAPQYLLLEFSARMEDATIGTMSAPVSGGSGPVPVQPGPSQPIDINVMDATANARLHLQLGVNSASGVFVRLFQVDLLNLTGQIRYATATGNVAPYRVMIETAVNNALRARNGTQIPLLPRTMALPEEMTLSVGTPTPGQGYLRVPLTVVTKLQTITLPGIKPVSP